MPKIWMRMPPFPIQGSNDEERIFFSLRMGRQIQSEKEQTKIRVYLNEKLVQLDLALSTGLLSKDFE
jgi:hypothetical protein